MLATRATLDEVAERLWHLAPSSTTVSAAAYSKKRKWPIECQSVLLCRHSNCNLVTYYRSRMRDYAVCCKGCHEKVPAQRHHCGRHTRQ